MSHPGNAPEGYGSPGDYPSSPYAPPPAPAYPPAQVPQQYSVPEANQYSVPDPGPAPQSPPAGGYPPQVPTQSMPVHDQFAGYAPGAAPVPTGYPGGPTSGPGYGAAPGSPAFPPSGSGYDPYNPGMGATAAMPQGVPVSGSPQFGAGGYPAPGYGQPEPARKGRSALIFGIIAALLFVSTGVFAGLYVVKSGDYTKKVNAAKTQQAADQSQISDLRTQLKAANDKYDELSQRQSGTQNQLDEITKEKQTISKCLNLLYEAASAAAAGDKTKYNSLLPQMNAACDEANKYLN